VDDLPFRSLDSISKNFGPVRVDVLGKIAEAVLGGLKYLYLAHRIMHRDIKPSNVLVNSRGQIKLCDFGVSSELVNSVADTFVGTGTYMAPERIQGSPYTVKSDVWSVGLTLMELAIGKFPFSIEADEDGDDEDASGPQGILDLLQQIVLEPAPKLPKSEAFPQILEDVIAKCLMKNPDERPTPQELYDTDPFLQAAKRTPVDLEQWAVSLMERHNRKSHLAPQLSPATKALLRGEETPISHQQQTPLSSTSTATTPHYSAVPDRTPTTGEIPISSVSSNGSAYPYPSSSSRDVRPYPTRTSSAQNANVERSSPMPGYGQGGQQMNLPIRQAPAGGMMPMQGRSSRPGTAGSGQGPPAEGYRKPVVPRSGYVQ
jgi:mitogen-activated protein kinase kinase